MPKEDLKNQNVLWIVYGNSNFKPCCGKVIFINEKQLKAMYCYQGYTDTNSQSRFI